MKSKDEMPDVIYAFIDNEYMQHYGWKRSHSEYYATVKYVRADSTPPQPDQPSDESRARALDYHHRTFGNPQTDHLWPGKAEARQTIVAALTAQKPAAEEVETRPGSIQSAINAMLYPKAQKPSAAVDLDALKRIIYLLPEIQGSAGPFDNVDKTVDYLAAQGWLAQPRGGA